MVALTALVSALLGLERYGITVVGALPSGFPHLSLPDIRFADVWTLLPPALILTLIMFTDAALTERSFAQKQGEQVDANQGLIGLAAANLAAWLLRGFPAAASQSRTAVNDAAGGKTPLVGVVAAALLVVFLLWFARLLESLPQVALASIIIAAAINLIEVRPILNRRFCYHPMEHLSPRQIRAHRRGLLGDHSRLVSDH